MIAASVLPPAVGASNEAMHAGKNRLNRLQLGRAQAAPAQGIHDVILQRRVKLLEFNHELNVVTPFVAPAAARSLVVISFSARVSL